MRIWDIAPSHLCRQHLLGEHRELHALWTVLTENKKGYSKHPETLRWKGKLLSLYQRHDALVTEMERRGYNHKTPLDRSLAKGSRIQDAFVHSVPEQVIILRHKGCGCDLRGISGLPENQ